MSEVDRAARRRRLGLWALAASLALNGFLIGAIATDQFAGERERRGMLHFETRIIGENLPEAEREIVRGTVRDMVPELREDWRRLRQLRREINALAAAREPARDDIDARLAEIRDITRAMQARVQDRVFDEVLALPPETRGRLAEDED